MTVLIPNLDPLLGVLPDTPAGRDARELVAAVADATSWQEVDEALDRVTTGWAAS